MGEMILKMKEIRINIIIIGLLYIVLGLMIALFPYEMIQALSALIGVILVIVGVIQIFGKFFDDQNRSSGILVGAVIAVIGVWIILNPRFIMSILPMVIGVMLVVSAIQKATMGFQLREQGFKKWWTYLIFAVIDFVIGAFCIIHAFAVGTLIAIVEGVMLIYVGITQIIAAFRINQIEKEMRGNTFADRGF